MLFLPFYLSSFILLASQTAVANDAEENAVFPETFKVGYSNATQECLSCLTDLVEDVCNAASGRKMDECVCNGKGASKLRDGCLAVCPYGTYAEWWLGCIEDDYLQWCGDVPEKTMNQGLDLTVSGVYHQYCASNGDIPSAAADAVSCTAGSDFDLSNFNRDCDETVYLDDVASDLESTGSVVASVKLVVGIVVVFAAAWLN